MKQIHKVLRVGFEPGTHGLEVQRPNHSATLPVTVGRAGLVRASATLLVSVRLSAPFSRALIGYNQQTRSPLNITRLRFNI